MDNNQPTGSNLEARYSELNDNDLKKILVKRKEYREEAVNVAIREAIRRGLINSEQDVFAEEYNPSVKARSFIFPTLENDYHREKLLSSINRTLYFIGLIPFVFAFMAYADDSVTETIAFAAVGMVWMFFNYKHFATKNSIYLYLLVTMSIIGFLYSLYVLISQPIHSVMDFVILMVGFVIVGYCLLFVNSLNRK